MSLENVRNEFRKLGIDQRIMVFDEPSATVEMAAKDIGCKPQEICKTMSFDVDGETVIIAMAGDVKIDNRKYKDYFHKKAKMLQGEEVEQRTTHPIGGVCPFALPEGTQLFLDESLKRFEKVYPACGSINSAICVTIEELENIIQEHQWISVTKSYE